MKLRELKEILNQLPEEANELEVVHNIEPNRLTQKMYGVSIDAMGILGNAIILGPITFFEDDEEINIVEVKINEEIVPDEKMKDVRNCRFESIH